jgi:hypothetical protein
MPTVRAIPTGSGFPQDAHVDMRLKIVYKRDGVDNNNNAIVNLRNDSAFYPANGWQNVSLNEAWNIDFGNDICGGTAYLFYRHDNGRTDTIIFYIRGTNPTETQIRHYLTQQRYDAYWFLIKIIRQESSLHQFGVGTNYTIGWKTGRNNASGEPLYGPPRGFGLKQLDNWGNNQHATPQHLWNWQVNIDAGVEILREKQNAVNRIRTEQSSIVSDWNEDYPDNPVSDSLYIEVGEGMGTTVLSVTEGTESFSVIPTPTNNRQHDIYDAVLIKLYNGSLPERYYHKIVTPEDGVSKPYRVINKLNSLGNNYVNNICNRPD